MRCGIRRKWNPSSAQNAGKSTSNATQSSNDGARIGVPTVRDLVKPDAPVKYTDQDGADI